MFLLAQTFGFKRLTSSDAMPAFAGRWCPLLQQKGKKRATKTCVGVGEGLRNWLRWLVLGRAAQRLCTAPG
jgi:hypothetical protein